MIKVATTAGVRFRGRAGSARGGRKQARGGGDGGGRFWNSSNFFEGLLTAVFPLFNPGHRHASGLNQLGFGPVGVPDQQLE